MTDDDPRVCDCTQSDGFHSFNCNAEIQRRIATAGTPATACICTHSPDEHSGHLGRCVGSWSNPVGVYSCSCDGYDVVDRDDCMETAKASCRDCGGTITVPFEDNLASVRWPYAEYPTDVRCPDCGLQQRTVVRRILT